MHWLHWFFLFFILIFHVFYYPQKTLYQIPPKELCSIPTQNLHLIIHFFYLPFASGYFLNYTILYPTVGTFYVAGQRFFVSLLVSARYYLLQKTLPARF